MNKREFITLLGGAAAWPLAAARSSREAADHRVPGRDHGFRQANGLPLLCSACVNSAGSRVGPSRSSIAGREGRSERMAEIAAEFVRLKVDVICHARNRSSHRGKAGDIGHPDRVRGSRDPVGSGLVASLARPGGNVTGLSNQSTDLAGKRLELLREVVPGLRRLAIMANVGNPIACWRCARFRQRPAHSASTSRTGNPSSRGYRARLRCAQGSR